MAADMNGKKQRVIEVLNQARGMELYAIMQYMHQHYTLDDKDYGKLAKGVREVAISEMRHAEWLAERIKDLDGVPTAQIDGQVVKSQDVREIYPFNGNVEDDTITKYNAFIKVCRENDDQVSANLFERILDEEQDHWNYFTDTDDHIKELGDHFLGRMAASGDAD